MTLVLVLSCSFTVSAASLIDGNITERVDGYGRIIRVYESNGSTTFSNNPEETKNLLLALGMDEDTVNGMSLEVLNEYATSPRIVATTTYSRIDSHNVAHYVDEATALAESKRLQNERMNNLKQGIAPAENAEFQDTYMKITYIVTPRGSGDSYRFSTDATWLTMPVFRGKDSIGSCAMNCTVTNETRSGKYSYDMTNVTPGNTSTTKRSGTISSSNLKNAVNGNWYGSAGIVDLPADVYGPTSSIVCSNFKAHYEYAGHVSSPNVEWFNTVASYDHATVAISASPSVSIDTSGSVSASIGLDIVGATDTRSAEIEIKHNH